MNFIEICVGIGMNQFSPEYIKIPVEIEMEDDEYLCPMCTISEPQVEDH
jgi:hypothetical protein